MRKIKVFYKFRKDYKGLKTALDRWVSFLNKAYELDKDENIKSYRKVGDNVPR